MGRRSRLISIVGGSAGNIIEWFDFLAYSVFSIYFSKAFFPGGNMTAQLLNTAAIAAAGYIVRPLGSWLIGVFADRHGRRAALSGAVAMMSLGSFIIAVTPTYATIGIAAPIVLVIARLLQGFSMGGEAGTSATYLAEMAPPGRRGFFVGFVQVTVVSGQLLALLLLLLLQYVLLTPAQLDAWGWRIPFCIGSVMALFALFLRRGIDETAAFEAVARSRPGDRRDNLLRVLWRYRKQVLLSIGISGRRDGRVLHLHDLFAEIHGEHRRFQPGPRDLDRDDGLADLHAVPAALRSGVRSDRAQAGAADLRLRRHLPDRPNYGSGWAPCMTAPRRCC